MFNHIMLGATDIEASKKFYDATLGVLHLRNFMTQRLAFWGLSLDSSI